MKKSLILSAILLIATSITSCKKEVVSPGQKGDTGAQGPQGEPGPDAKTFNFTLTFAPGDTYQSYSGITGYDSGDALLFYAKYNNYGDGDYYVPLPVVINGINYLPEFNENTGSLYINTTLDGGASPWTTSSTLKFKVILIKSSGLIKHPGVDLSNYNEVIQTFDLE